MAGRFAPLLATAGRPAMAVNNRLVRRWAVDRDQVNPRPLIGCEWNERVEARFPEIRAEWDRFVAAGGVLPLIEDLIAEHQGNVGAWRAGLLVHEGQPVTDLARSFPATIDALSRVPGVLSALWSVLEPDAELPEHAGPNAGVLRYHLGVDCGFGAALRVDDHVIPYRDGRGILFDDTAPHAAWNRGPAPRITVMCELLRPLPMPARAVNEAFQRVLAHDPRYRTAADRADAHLEAQGPRD